MPIRGLWIFYHRPGGRGEVKFSRHYPTVEKRAKAFNRASYVNIPEDVDLLKALLHELGLTNEEKNFVEYRDNCARISKTNVYSLVVSEGNLWPVLAIQSGDFIYVCLPLVEQLLTPVPPLINVSSISEAFSLLSGIMQFVNSGHNAEADVSFRLTQLPLLVTQACPLGSPLDTDFFALPDNLSNASANQSYKSPAWKTSKQKGKAQIEVYITEKVNSTQYDKGDDSDTWQVHGTVSCKVPVPPILGFYQLTDDGHQVQISVKLKLHESIKNGFDYCEAQIPFFNKGQIKHFEYKVSHGHLELSREKSLVVWVIGQKFPKSLEISLSGTVTFLSEKHLNDPVDPICVGNTAYVKLLFRIPDYSLTGCYTDQHSVQVFSTAKPKILTSRELISADYFLWNSKAPAPIVCRSFFD